MSLKQVLKLVDNLTPYGLERVSLTGGEPTLWGDWELLLEELAARSLRFTLTTNAFRSSLMLKSNLDIWKHGKLLVSIDSVRQQHDFLRGKGSFQACVDLLHKLRPDIPFLGVNSVLIWHPRFWADELYNLLESVGVDQWAIISPLTSGRWDSRLTTTDNDTDYASQFEYIRTLVGQSTTTMSLKFWNYRNSHDVRDTLSVDCDGTINLPGYYASRLPSARTTHIDVPQAAEQIVEACQALYSTGQICYF